MTDEREQYYSKMRNYSDLESIRTMIINGQQDRVYQAVKQGLDSGNIISNDLIRHPLSRKDVSCWVPLIYAVSLTNVYSRTFDLLLERGANPRLEPDMDPEQLVPIIFSCHPSYFGKLVQYIGKPKYSSQVIDRNILSKIKEGEWEHLDLLHDAGFINMKTFCLRTKGKMDLISVALKNMTDYLMFCYNYNSEDYDKTAETNKTVAKFAGMARMLHNWGASVTSSTIDICLKFYLFEVLEATLGKKSLSVPLKLPVNHESMDPLVVATFRPLLNDFRYGKTLQIVKRINES